MNRITAENETAVKCVLDNIFDNFEFEKVKKAMDALDWKWDGMRRADIQTGELKVMFDVPTLDEIKMVAARLMWECANMDTDCLARCGFRVEKDFTDPDDPWMRLTFEVTDWAAAGAAMVPPPASELDND